jgi:hypothetical protein
MLFRGSFFHVRKQSTKSHEPAKNLRSNRKLLPQQIAYWCFDYRATQTGRGQLSNTSKVAVLGPEKTRRQMAMIDEVTPHTKEKKFYKVCLILLIALSSVSGIKKDLNALLSFAGEVHSFANNWLSVLPVNQSNEAAAGVCQVKESESFAPVLIESSLRPRVVNKRSIRIKSLKRDLRATNGRIIISLPANLDMGFSGESLSGANASDFPVGISVDQLKGLEHYDWTTQPSLADAH